MQHRFAASPMISRLARLFLRDTTIPMFEIRAMPFGRWGWVLKDGFGELMASHEGFSSRAAARRAARAAKAVAARAEIVDAL